MGASTAISWTDSTFNPWWGCQRISPGCERCYAETFSKRVGQEVWGAESSRRFFGAKHWDEPRKWNKAAIERGQRARVFCASMADVFERRKDGDAERLLRDERIRLFRLIEETPQLDWQLLTKRPENVMAMVPLLWLDGFPPNVWMGTSAEDQQRANQRLPILRGIPASIRFVSVEPMLGPVDIDQAMRKPNGTRTPGWGLDLHWTIIGGESGPGARVCDVRWIRALIAQCAAAGSAVFVKQLGAHPLIDARDDRTISGWRRRALSDPKGGDWDEWPLDLRVRQFPEVLA